MECQKFYMTVILLTNLMNVVVSLGFERPPPFPNIYKFFSNSLKTFSDSWCSNYTQPDVCNCTACLVQNWTVYNTAEDYPELSCDRATTVVETTIKPTLPATIRTIVRTTTTTAKAIVRTTTNAPTTAKTVSDTSHPTTSPELTSEVPTEQTTATNKTVIINASLHTTSKLSINAIIAIVCSCLLALLVTVAILFALRKLVLAEKNHRPKRKRSDRIHLNSNQESAPTTPSPEGGNKLTSGYTNSAFHWHDGESTDSSGVENTQHILNPTDPKNDYNTLKVLDHPHALNMGGFGESTDTMTLKKKSNKKRRGSKKTDTNHNRKGSLGTNSTGHHSPESTTGPKGSIKSKSSITSKASIKSKSSNSNMNGMVERRLSLAGHGISAGITLPKGTAVLFSELKAKEDDDDLLDSNNVHLFAYDNPAVSNSATSLSSLHCSSTILPPPPEFQDDKVKGSPFNTSDRGHIEDPPTAIVRPSVKQPPAKVILNQREPNNSVHIPMQDFAHSCTNTFQREDCRSDLTASAAGMDPTMAPSSFLWSLNDKTFVS